MGTYFSQHEFEAMLAEVTANARLRWFALSGKPLNAKQSDRLNEVLEKFFRSTKHRAFRKTEKK